MLIMRGWPACSPSSGAMLCLSDRNLVTTAKKELATFNEYSPQEITEARIAENFQSSETISDLQFLVRPFLQAIGEETG
jgi:hypothetical protein